MKPTLHVIHDFGYNPHLYQNLAISIISRVVNSFDHVIYADFIKIPPIQIDHNFESLIS